MPRRALVVLLALGLTVGSGCTDDDREDDDSTTTVAVDSTPTTTGDGDDDLDAVLLTADDLPPGFEPSGAVDDTVTSFCATHDAAAGLQASGRAIVGFARAGGGASVIQLAFRFEEGGAAAFVAQAEAAMSACSGVPDGSGTGLAFEYEPLSPAVAGALATAGEARSGGFGTSVGSGSLTVEIAVAHQGDVATLVAVLGLDEPREALDELAAAVFSTVAQRLTA
ncbi:MAG: hypothetical protein ACLGI8_12425 [Acidimicrobiia bacterium]